MIQSRISPKARTTIPDEVMLALGLRPGDRLVYRIENGRVALIGRDVPDDPFATFTEWGDDADRQAFAQF
jgi:antitoxin PrlF